MKEKNIFKAKHILNQLEKIESINRMLESSKRIDSKFEVRQYEHLKKQYVQNLFIMLAENYQIPIPTPTPKKEAA